MDAQQQLNKTIRNLELRYDPEAEHTEQALKRGLKSQRRVKRKWLAELAVLDKY